MVLLTHLFCKIAQNMHGRKVLHALINATKDTGFDKGLRQAQKGLVQRPRCLLDARRTSRKVYSVQTADQQALGMQMVAGKIQAATVR